MKQVLFSAFLLVLFVRCDCSGPSLEKFELGEDQNDILVGDTVSLESDILYCHDNSEQSVKWSILSIPSDSTYSLDSVNIQDSNKSTASFQCDVAGEFVIQMEATEGDHSETRTTKVNCIHRGVTAICNDHQFVEVAENVQLDGSASSAMQGDLEYEWVFASKPEESQLEDGDIPNTEPSS